LLIVSKEDYWKISHSLLNWKSRDFVMERRAECVISYWNLFGFYLLSNCCCFIYFVVAVVDTDLEVHERDNEKILFQAL